MRALATLLVATQLYLSTSVVAAPTAISEPCRSAIDSELQNWRYPVISSDVASWANEEHFNPVVAIGDFDGNGETDEALLLEAVKGREIAVCFSRRHRTMLKVIERPYCSDYVAVSPARSEHYNYESDAIETIGHDGISVGCFEKAGATYLYEHGAFRRIIDSD
jgi:hypothetical protein